MAAEWNATSAAAPAGLQEAEIDTLAAELPFALTTELREWFKWHDGVLMDAEVQETSIGPGGWRAMPLEECVRTYWSRRQDLGTPINGVSDTAGYVWGETLFPFLDGGKEDGIADCGVPTPEFPTPIRVRTWEWDDFVRVRADSLSDAVDLWTWWIREGKCRWTETQWGWQWERDIPPMLLIRTALL